MFAEPNYIPYNLKVLMSVIISLDPLMSPALLVSGILKVKLVSRVQLFVAPWTVAYEAIPFTEVSRQQYWTGVPFPSAGDLPNPGIKPRSPALRADTFTIWATREAIANTSIRSSNVTLHTALDLSPSRGISLHGRRGNTADWAPLR